MSKEKTITFPEVTNTVFGGIPDQIKWEKMAKNAGFSVMRQNKYCEYVNKLFFKSGKLPKRRKDIPDEYYTKGVRLLKCWLVSFEPKHERKTEVGGFILSLICDIK